MNAAGIVGMGLWVPETIRRNDAWPESFVRAFHEQPDARQAKDFTHIERRNHKRPFEELFLRHALPYDSDPFKGAVERRIASPDIPTVEGDAAAARIALKDANIEPGEVDLVLSSAVVQDQLVPSNGPAIQDLVGCVNAPGIGVESYCSAAIAQLDLAAPLVETGRARFVLCVQSHQINRINDMEQAVSPIFGDASTAFVVGAVPEGRGLVRMVRSGDGSLRGAVTHVCRDAPGATWWKDGAGPTVPGIVDPGAAVRLATNALEYPIQAIRQLCDIAEMPLDAVATIAMIQPLAWYQAAVADGLGISIHRIPSTYGVYAHIGGCAIVANLIESRRRGLVVDGSPVVLYAHGAGIARYAALLRWHATSSRTGS
jgi:3-oxoacyl-[acyl-carrier-protein] synthase-3